MEAKEEDPVISRLETACLELKILLKNSSEIDRSLEKMDKNFENFHEKITNASKRVAPIHSHSVATKALETRINRAVSPALSLLDSFKLAESLQHKLVDLSSKLAAEKSSKSRLNRLEKYVNCVNELNSAINSISQDSEPAIQKLQEVVEFLSRTKATDQYRIHRLRETLITLKALYENEVDAMRFDGLLDEALLNLQDEYEGILQGLRHRNIGEEREEEEDEDDNVAQYELGSDLEVDLLREISETLAANDCLDICIDIFVKVRYRRAAKALMRLNPDYLRTYTPEEIDDMEWESLETSITLWIQHFELTVRTVLVAEKNLSSEVLGNVMDGLIWHECFVKIADKIMAVFFRFGEGVARSNKEPQKLFKLLEMFESMENLKVEFAEVFEGEAGDDICLRFRELEKLLIHAASKVFWEFGLQIEGNQDGHPPPLDGSIPKLVRYAINYLKYLTTDTYAISMAKVLKTEQVWKNGILSKPESEENLLKEAVANVIEALQRNVEAKQSRYSQDKVIAHVFSMNTNWYIYMRTKGSELGKLMGDQYMKKRYKLVAEESAYMYQKQAWGSLVKLLTREDDAAKAINKEAIGALARGKMEAFTNGFNEMLQKHRRFYTISDPDLREQIREATLNFVVPAYTDFVNAYASVLNKTYFLAHEVEEAVARMFEERDRKMVGRRNWKDRAEDRHSESVDRPREVIDYRRSKSSADNL